LTNAARGCRANDCALPGSTFASRLLTAGVQLGYVSQQLGHADVSVTARHYARWVGGSSYRAAMRVEPGEVSADLLARLDSPHKRSGRRAAFSKCRPSEGIPG